MVEVDSLMCDGEQLCVSRELKDDGCSGVIGEIHGGVVVASTSSIVSAIADLAV